MPGRPQPPATTAPTSFAMPTPPPTRSKQRPKSSSHSTPSARLSASGIAPSQHSTVSPRAILSGSHGRNMETELNLPANTEVPSILSLSSATASAAITENVYHAVATRKTAEDTVKQLARRITHYRAQEERVLREVREVKSKLESLATQQQQQALPSNDYHLQVQVWTSPTSRATGSKQPCREPNTLRSRDQLQFLKNGYDKSINARWKNAQQDRSENVDLAYFDFVLLVWNLLTLLYSSSHATSQNHLLEILDGQHRERLTMEKEREDHALDLIEQMREEETQLALRLQALKFHHEFIKRGLNGTCS
ncbi:hypothetical protein FI667_g3422, partial [Globisporangium splendens]